MYSQKIKIVFFVLLASNSRAFISLSQYESPHFMCQNFDEFCGNILDQVGCGENSEDRVSVGCATPNVLSTWSGICKCERPIHFEDAGPTVTYQLIENRISGDIKWLLEPYNTGPPYNLKASYTNICDLTLTRLGCLSSEKVVSVQLDSPITAWQCCCGNLTEPSQKITDLILGALNNFEQKSHPIFSDPYYLNVPLSVCAVLLCGKIGAILAVYFIMPPIVGFLLAGFFIQNVLNPIFLQGTGYPYPSPASELKVLALIIVLMRAGLAIKFEEIRKNLSATLSLSTFPYICEVLVWLFVGRIILGWPIVTMGLFASIMAPLGPSVVLSGLLNLIASSEKNHGYVPKQILTTTPIEAVFAIILFGIFSNLEQATPDHLYPWVEFFPTWKNCAFIPINLFCSTLLGFVIGWMCSRYVNWRIELKTDFLWIWVSKNPQVGSSTGDLVFVLVVCCYSLFSLCTKAYMQNCSGVLVVFSLCITVSKFTEPKTAASIAQGLKGIWVFAEVFLFTLTGTTLSFDPSNGPLNGERGLSFVLMKSILIVMAIGSFSRFLGIGLSLLFLYHDFPEHRKKSGWMALFWINCWIFQLPKATVQATLGSAAYTQHIIPGAAGLNQARIIQQATAFAVLVYAPLGSLLTNTVGSHISCHLAECDRLAGWDSEHMLYMDSKKGQLQTEYMESSSDSEERHEGHFFRSRDLSLREPETIVDLMRNARESFHTSSARFREGLRSFRRRESSGLVQEGSVHSYSSP